MIAWDHKSELVAIDGSLNDRRYVNEILRPNSFTPYQALKHPFPAEKCSSSHIQHAYREPFSLIETV